MDEKERQYDIKFRVSFDLYQRVKAQADKYCESVGPFVRHLLVDHLEKIESSEVNKRALDAIPVLHEIQQKGFTDGNDIQKVLPEVVKMLGAIQVREKMEGKNVLIRGNSEE